MAALPPIPRTIYLAAGRIPVRRRKGMLEKEHCVGEYNWKKRACYLDKGLDIHAAWLTLRHERVHAVLMDAGIIGIDPLLEERICDALAAADVHEMLTGRTQRVTK